MTDLIGQLTNVVCLSIELDVLVADQLNFFIVFFEIYWLLEWHPCPFVGAYMVPRPRDKSFLIGGPISLILSAHGMCP